ncbi:hypothetical protein, partial [Microseira sp. BLCC-F43]|uniref:hypothetical protein n=1 Tax=Microseira sp. BLCC-F43 TaxID=3153602 RepID=UPI0035B76541
RSSAYYERLNGAQAPTTNGPTALKRLLRTAQRRSSAYYERLNGAQAPTTNGSTALKRLLRTQMYGIIPLASADGLLRVRIASHCPSNTVANNPR